jgi:PAS domain S-box-containing protein
MMVADLSGIIFGLPEPMLLVEPGGMIIAVNPGASRLFRRRSAELLGKPLDGFVTDDHEKLSRYLRQCSRNSEGIPGGFSIRPSDMLPVSCKVMGGFVRHHAPHPRLLWLRFLPCGAPNDGFAAYSEYIRMSAREKRAGWQNEQRWRTAFENSAIGITMADFSGRYFAANSVFLNMLGYTASELYQMTFTDVTHEDDRKANLNLVRELVEGKRQHFQIEKRYCRKDSSLVWVRNNVALVPGMGTVEPFWFGIVEDITQRRRIEEALRVQIEVLQNIQAVAWTVTPDGRCDFVNQFFLDATGISREYIQSPPDEWNKSGSDLPPLFSGLPLQDRERVASLFWNGIRTGEGWAFEAQHFHASDGTYHWYFDRAVPLRDSQGKVVRFVGTCAEIEPLKRVQQSLRESETRLQAFCENSPNLIFLKDRQGRYVYVNKEFTRAFCISEEQIKGKRDDEIFSAEQAAAFQANDRQVLEAGVPMEFEEMSIQKDGQHTSIVQKFPLFNTEQETYAIGGIATDISERKRSEKDLLALRDELAAELTAMTRLHEFSTHLLAMSEFQPRLEEVLDATIALQNADLGNIQLYSPATKALEIVAQRGFKPDFLEYFENVYDNGTACGRAMELRKRVIIEDVELDSAYAPHRHIAASAGFRAVQSTPLFSGSGEFLGILSTHFRRPHRPSLRDLRFTDLYARHAAEIIERRRLEAARSQVEEQYRAVQAELARVSRLTTMGELAASIAHEVNQPLAAIANNSNGCLRLLADHHLEPEVLRQALKEIVTDATRASAVIARTRAFIKKAPAEKNRLDINEVIEEVLALIGHELYENRVLLERQLKTALPLVLGDRVQLQQVVLNLIVNAIEATNLVTDRARLLWVQTRVDESGEVLVSIADSGPGVGAETGCVFTPFFTTKPNGMGMGLSISRSIIEDHGGRLWATANSPNGAVFCFTLPGAAKNPS